MSHIVKISCFFSPGILTLTITNPIWVTKTRLVLQYNADSTSKQYKGMVDALVKIYRYEGVPGLYRVRHRGILDFHIVQQRMICLVLTMAINSLYCRGFFLGYRTKILHCTA